MWVGQLGSIGDGEGRNDRKSVNKIIYKVHHEEKNE